eukprot:scaffold13874_cov128-Isochrysis_galbana.AAC.2
MEKGLLRAPFALIRLIGGASGLERRRAHPRKYGPNSSASSARAKSCVHTLRALRYCGRSWGSNPLQVGNEPNTVPTEPDVEECVIFAVSPGTAGCQWTRRSAGDIYHRVVVGQTPPVSPKAYPQKARPRILSSARTRTQRVQLAETADPATPDTAARSVHQLQEGRSAPRRGRLRARRLARRCAHVGRRALWTLRCLGFASVEVECGGPGGLPRAGRAGRLLRERPRRGADLQP